MEKLKCKECLKDKIKNEFYHTPEGKLDSYICNDCRKIRNHLWYENNKVKCNKASRQWVKDNPEKRKEVQKKSNKKTRDTKRLQVMKYYSNETLQCACCGESIYEFLTINHINNDGAEHRRTVGSGTAFHYWLVKNNFPEGYQVLCFNCNCGRNITKDKVCPHKKLNK